MLFRAHSLFGDRIRASKSDESNVRAYENAYMNKCQYLIVSSTAYRGLYFPNVQAVINYSMPGCQFDYINRLGRLANTNKKAESHSFIVKDFDKGKVNYLIDVSYLIMFFNCLIYFI
jgi:superfamily II DNA/RNA helicase